MRTSISGTSIATTIHGSPTQRRANFRYGDTAPLRRNYLPADYRADCAAHRVVASVHVEAEWDPRDPVGETRWLPKAPAETDFRPQR